LGLPLGFDEPDEGIGFPEALLPDLRLEFFFTSGAPWLSRVIWSVTVTNSSASASKR
jgi:hypothetical protein